jgi:hypothetical protein
MYYPPNKIKTGLYTSGKEFVLSTNSTEYIGFYFSTFDGKFFTGKQVGDTNNVELKSYSDFVKSSPDYKFVGNEFYYNKVNNNIQNLSKKLIPQPYNPNPTQEDYEKGFFNRYFIKRTNGNDITEISKETYNDLNSKQKYDSALYDKIEVRWTLIGLKQITVIKGITNLNVNTINFVAIQNANRNLPGLNQFITDFTEFVKF